MEIVTLTRQEYTSVLREAARTGAQIALAESQIFEVDLPATEIREKLQATDARKWKKILQETGAKITRTIGCIDMYRPSSFPQLRASGYMPAA